MQYALQGLSFNDTGGVLPRILHFARLGVLPSLENFSGQMGTYYQALTYASHVQVAHQKYRIRCHSSL
jgi:hypothetical protein